ncbi:MAG TPA: nucleotide sugar dehydrogenase [Gaiellaceae bacterium]|nr:nucleotide sugar dehydrogenase [Gaiellaceae bacterium]
MTPEIAVVGAGYVGVPLADTFADAGKPVVLVDIAENRVAQLNRGESYIQDVPSEKLREHVSAGLIDATTDYDVLKDVAAILIALPTPLSKQREPDLSIVAGAVGEIAPRLRKGHVVVLESTTYPGTTRDLVQPILEQGSGLRAGVDFHLAFSPERVDPGRSDWTTKTTPKVIGGLTPECTAAAAAIYRGAVDEIVEVSSPEAAELTKLLENIFRSVNIALVNELARLCGRMKIDVWEVIEAAATKPFGFMSFKPGPGLGGHCIPIDPFYLTWKAREYDFTTEFIELAGKVNQSMPYYCRSLISQAMNHGAGKSLAGSKVLVLGVSYKRDIGDMRESPALKVIELMRNAGAEVSYHDPHVPELREEGLRSVALEPAAYDCVVIVTDHSSIDYEQLVEEASLVVDLRNATGRSGTQNGKVWKL